MVNVGGRSKGCTTCRRRRVKCDETWPVCRRCEKGGFHCEGPKSTTFIAGTIVKSRRSEPAQERPDARKPGFAIQPIRPSSFTPRQNEREVSICYTRKHLLPNGPIDFALQNLKTADIDLTTIETRCKSSNQPFNLASLSFSMLYFGTQHRQTSITNKGYALYGQALKQLNRTLSDSQSCHRDDVILSVVTLAILECLIPTGPRNYLKHMLGLERLLELRNPQSLVSCSPTSSTLYKGVRHMILFASLRTGRPSILARPEWKAALRSHCSNDELQEQGLYDVLADCTVLLAERDKQLDTWDANTAGFEFQQNELECKAMALLADLWKWKARWNCDEKHAYREENGVIWHLDQIDVVGKYTPIFPTILRFVGDSSARLLMLYNTTLIYVLRILTPTPTEQCKGHLLPRLSFPGEQKPAGLWGCIVKGQFSSAERLSALEIVRCIPDYVSRKRLQSNGQFSSPVVQWAVTTAWAALGGNESAEGKWMMKLLNGNNDQVIANGVWESSPTAGKIFSTTVDLDKACSKILN